MWIIIVNSSHTDTVHAESTVPCTLQANVWAGLEFINKVHLS